jgi:acyl-CoA reductase-like NAD-dependent aldehyde dehydrogenase
MSAPHNPPAFPVKVKRNTSTDPLATPREVQFEGMTLRDWIAGQAFAAAFGRAESLGTLDAEVRAAVIKQVAELIYEAADAMLAAREAGKP